MSDLFVAWRPGLCSKCRLIRGSFSGNQADPHMEYIQSIPLMALLQDRCILNSLRINGIFHDDKKERLALRKSTTIPGN